ncbi:hypothetical protein PSTG_03141 [Puccinia striiformis f. sp. tritici PST-78]|uniref:Tyr recombinase domain-containing protein n=1 Tax=Puccinia striiformis f. sp. tritici PST-78 TaxID=1165861 RepID=A0A0L0VWC9_9BASI|nr:hypothetical protein PSTG_03141 [Puccinia striiformis f. sp. tritici PST-78]
MDLAKITHFLHRGSKERRLSPTDTRVLEGWKWSTLLGYNAAVKKFKTFKTAIGESDYNLPLSSDDVYAFEAWAGRGANDNGAKKINATSLTHYLHALKAWHTFHDATYPYHTEKRVKLMLKASGRQDATLPAKQGKSPVLIPDLADLFRLLLGRGPEAEAVKDLAIVAFWGMVRLAELTYQSNSGPARLKKELTIREVTTFQNVTTLTIHEAKTAKPGELQTIKLHHMNSPLCPAKAIERRKQATRTDFDALFGYTTGNRRVNLTKRRVNEILRAVWSDLGRPRLTGHSFRVGGATLRNAVGIEIGEIKSLGRWTTDCYKRYVKTLSRDDFISSLEILELQEF